MRTIFTGIIKTKKKTINEIYNTIQALTQTSNAIVNQTAVIWQFRMNNQDVVVVVVSVADTVIIALDSCNTSNWIDFSWSLAFLFEFWECIFLIPIDVIPKIKRKKIICYSIGRIFCQIWIVPFGLSNYRFGWTTNVCITNSFVLFKNRIYYFSLHKIWNEAIFPWIRIGQHQRRANSALE